MEAILYLLKVKERFAQIVPECISEHLISKFFRGSMPPDPPSAIVSRARPFFPVLVGVAGSAAGEKGLVSLGHSLLQRGMQ